MSLLRSDAAPSTELVIHDRRAASTLEVRDPRASTQKVSWSSPILPQVDEWNADQAFRLGYLANVIAFRAIQIRANAIASIPIVAGRRMGDPTSINETSPLTRFFGPPPGGPAPKLSARKLIRWTIAQDIVTGRRAWEIETADGSEDGRPVAFWPLPTAHLRAVASKKGVEWFTEFHYGKPHDPVKLKPGNVFFGWEPSGTDFRQATSPLQALRYDLSLVTLCDRYGMAFLRNNAVPAAVVTTTAFPDDDTRRQFRQQWGAEFRGADNAGRTHFHEVSLDGDGPVAHEIDVKVLGLSAKDARLIEQRREAMMEVAIGLGVPWSKFDASGRTFDNADAEDRSFYEETVLPQLLDLQDDINQQIAPRFGDEVVWFDLRGVRALQRRIQPITQTVGVPSLVQAQLMTINEARADYGLEPTDDGDRMMTAEEIAALRGAVGGAPDPAAAARSVLAPAEVRTVEEEDETIAPAVETRTAHPAESRAVDPDEIEQRRARIWRATATAVTALESRWTRTMRRLFTRQQEATIARLTGKRGRQALGYGLDGLPLEIRSDPAPNVDPAAIFDDQFWTAQTAEAAADLYDETAVNALTRLAAQLDVSFDLEAPYVREFVEARANQLAGQVTQTTYDAIRAQLVDGVAAGESIDDLAARIRTVFAQASELRAVTIARTEVISAYNGAAVMGASQLPADVIAAQEWIATRDGRVRPEHAAADGQVAPIGSGFSVAGVSLGYPGDPSGPADQVVNCRCTVAFLTPDEYAEVQQRSRPRIEARTAKALLRLVPANNPEFDLLAWRRAAEEVAA